MADETLELEDGELVASAADVQLRAQLHEAAAVLRHRGLPDLARLALGLVDAADVGHLFRILNEAKRGGFLSGNPVLWAAFLRTIRMRLLISVQETGCHFDEVFSEAFPAIVLEAAQHAAQLVLTAGFGVVAASAAAVRSLEKQTFRTAAGGNENSITECSICVVEFEDGGQVSVMPCPSGVHKFHTDCISKWLAISNVCPLCRHQLPAAYYE